MVRKALLLVFIVIILTGCSKQQDILSRIEYFSGVKMPNEAQLVYNYIDTSFGAQGHGCQYTVFSFEEEPIDFLLVNIVMVVNYTGQVLKEKNIIVMYTVEL